jgi:hypothetical protein
MSWRESHKTGKYHIWQQEEQEDAHQMHTALHRRRHTQSVGPYAFFPSCTRTASLTYCALQWTHLCSLGQHRIVTRAHEKLASSLRIPFQSVCMIDLDICETWCLKFYLGLPTQTLPYLERICTHQGGWACSNGQMPLLLTQVPPTCGFDGAKVNKFKTRPKLDEETVNEWTRNNRFEPSIWDDCS